MKRPEMSLIYGRNEIRWGTADSSANTKHKDTKSKGKSKTNLYPTALRARQTKVNIAALLMRRK